MLEQKTRTCEVGTIGGKCHVNEETKAQKDNARRPSRHKVDRAVD